MFQSYQIYIKQQKCVTLHQNELMHQNFLTAQHLYDCRRFYNMLDLLFICHTAYSNKGDQKFKGPEGKCAASCVLCCTLNCYMCHHYCFCFCPSQQTVLTQLISQRMCPVHKLCHSFLRKFSPYFQEVFLYSLRFLTADVLTEWQKHRCY